jgi:hypothetical protein
MLFLIYTGLFAILRHWGCVQRQHTIRTVGDEHILHPEAHQGKCADRFPKCPPHNFETAWDIPHKRRKEPDIPQACLCRRLKPIFFQVKRPKIAHSRKWPLLVSAPVARIAHGHCHACF